jgi:hypothetical protein
MSMSTIWYRHCKARREDGLRLIFCDKLLKLADSCWSFMMQAPCADRLVSRLFIQAAKQPDFRVESVGCRPNPRRGGSVVLSLQ